MGHEMLLDLRILKVFEHLVEEAHNVFSRLVLDVRPHEFLDILHLFAGQFDFTFTVSVDEVCLGLVFYHPGQSALQLGLCFHVNVDVFEI